MSKSEKDEEKIKTVQVKHPEWHQLMILKLKLNMDSINDVIQMLLREREHIRVAHKQEVDQENTIGDT